MILLAFFIFQQTMSHPIDAIPANSQGVILNPYQPENPEHDVWIFNTLQTIQGHYRSDPQSLSLPGIHIDEHKVVIDPKVQPQLVSVSQSMLGIRAILGIESDNPALRDYKKSKLRKLGLTTPTIEKLYEDLNDPSTEVNQFVGPKFRKQKLAIWKEAILDLDAIEQSDHSEDKKEILINARIGQAIDQVLMASLHIELDYAQTIIDLLPKHGQMALIKFANQEIGHFDQVPYSVGHISDDIPKHRDWLKKSREKVLATTP